MEFCEELKQVFSSQGIELTPKMINDFKTYYDMLVSWNEKFNLTTITSQTDVIKKHFLDSVMGKDFILPDSKILDIGAGAGFPSIPLKIIYPNLKITLIDSVNKKVCFLNEVIKDLNLKNVEALHVRAEDLAQKFEYREKFDFVVSRAVASLNTLSEYALPFVKIGGNFIAYKSGEIEEELDFAKNAIKLLGGKCAQVVHKDIFEMQRTFIIISKKEVTPNKFPRGKNKPRTNPL